MFLLTLGANLLQGYMSYTADKAAAKAKRAWQEYSNTMLRLSDAQNQNSITTNELLNEQASKDQAIGIQQSNILTTAQAEVSAAAAGTAGRSVDLAMLDINRNAAVAERERQVTLTNTRLAFDTERVKSSMSAAMQQDYSYIPKPKLGSYLLSAAANSLGSLGGSKGTTPSVSTPAPIGPLSDTAHESLPWSTKYKGSMPQPQSQNWFQRNFW